jgi:hypothetical protein
MPSSSAARAGAVLAGLAVCALAMAAIARETSVVERLQIVYVPAAALRQQPVLARTTFLPWQMLVCPPESAHCGYGGTDTSEEAYNNPDPLAIINEHCTAENRSDCWACCRCAICVCAHARARDSEGGIDRRRESACTNALDACTRAVCQMGLPLPGAHELRPGLAGNMASRGGHSGRPHARAESLAGISPPLFGQMWREEGARRVPAAGQKVTPCAACNAQDYPPSKKKQLLVSPQLLWAPAR